MLRGTASMCIATGLAPWSFHAREAPRMDGPILPLLERVIVTGTPDPGAARIFLPLFWIFFGRGAEPRHAIQPSRWPP